jgi:hypothetical protein
LAEDAAAAATAAAAAAAAAEAGAAAGAAVVGAAAAAGVGGVSAEDAAAASTAGKRKHYGWGGGGGCCCGGPATATAALAAAAAHSRQECGGMVPECAQELTSSRMIEIFCALYIYFGFWCAPTPEKCTECCMMSSFVYRMYIVFCSCALNSFKVRTTPHFQGIMHTKCTAFNVMRTFEHNFVFVYTSLL